MEPLKFCQKANAFLFIGKSQNPKEEYEHDQCLQNNFHFLLKEVAEPKFHIKLGNPAPIRPPPYLGNIPKSNNFFDAFPNFAPPLP